MTAAGQEEADMRLEPVRLESMQWCVMRFLFFEQTRA